LYTKGPFKGQPRTWWGQAKNGDYYRYSHSNNGTAHFSGSYTIRAQEIPQHIRNRFNGRNGGSGGGRLDKLVF